MRPAGPAGHGPHFVTPLWFVMRPAKQTPFGSPTLAREVCRTLRVLATCASGARARAAEWGPHNVRVQRVGLARHGGVTLTIFSSAANKIKVVGAAAAAPPLHAAIEAAASAEQRAEFL